MPCVLYFDEMVGNGLSIIPDHSYISREGLPDDRKELPDNREELADDREELADDREGLADTPDGLHNSREGVFTGEYVPVGRAGFYCKWNDAREKMMILMSTTSSWKLVRKLGVEAFYAQCQPLHRW